MDHPEKEERNAEDLAREAAQLHDWMSNPTSNSTLQSRAHTAEMKSLAVKLAEKVSLRRTETESVKPEATNEG